MGFGELGFGKTGFSEMGFGETGSHHVEHLKVRPKISVNLSSSICEFSVKLG